MRIINLPIFSSQSFMPESISLYQIPRYAIHISLSSPTSFHIPQIFWLIVRNIVRTAALWLFQYFLKFWAQRGYHYIRFQRNVIRVQFELKWKCWRHKQSTLLYYIDLFIFSHKFSDTTNLLALRTDKQTNRQTDNSRLLYRLG